MFNTLQFDACGRNVQMDDGAKFVKNIVKLIGSAKSPHVVTLSLVMIFTGGPIEAQAENLFYNFTFTGVDNRGLASGQFEVQPGGGSGLFPDLIVNVTGNVSNSVFGSGPITSILSPGAFNGNTNTFSSLNPWVSLDGVGFTTGTSFKIVYANNQEWYLNNYISFETNYLGSLVVEPISQ